MFRSLGQRHLLCPFCRYDLRGAEGETITCPECGNTIERRELTRPDYTHPYNAMLRSTLLAPVCFVLTWPVVALIAGFAIGGANHDLITRIIVVMLGVGAVLWLALFIVCGLRFGGVRGLGLAFLLHVVLLVYFGSLLWLGIAAVVLVLGVLSAGGDFFELDLFWPSMATLAMAAAYLVARRCDRYVWRECWKRQLRMRNEGSSS